VRIRPCHGVWHRRSEPRADPLARVVPAVLLSPRSVFVPLREEDCSARDSAGAGPGRTLKAPRTAIGATRNPVPPPGATSKSGSTKPFARRTHDQGATLGLLDRSAAWHHRRSPRVHLSPLGLLRGPAGSRVSPGLELGMRVTGVGATEPSRAFPSPFEAPFEAPPFGSTTLIAAVGVRTRASVGLQTQMRHTFGLNTGFASAGGAKGCSGPRAAGRVPGRTRLNTSAHISVEQRVGPLARSPIKAS
jgi:hypothetical protein